MDGRHIPRLVTGFLLAGAFGCHSGSKYPQNMLPQGGQPAASAVPPSSGGLFGSKPPPGMPLAYQMGPDQVLTPVEGPHSTYLSLLSEVGLLGFVGLVCWEVAAILRAYRESRHRVSSWSVSSTNAAILLASLAVVTVYNCFFEMNQSGTLVFIALLAVAYRTRQPQPNGRQSP